MIAGIAGDGGLHHVNSILYCWFVYTTAVYVPHELLPAEGC